MRRHLLVLAAVAGLIAPFVAAAGSASAEQAATGPAALTWGGCPPAPPDIERDPRTQCATLRVPLDYREPAGRKISIEVSRIPTAKPGLRRGVLFANPGGPGGTGLDYTSRLLSFMPAEVTDRFDLIGFDLIGFDPRGIGYSTPVTCGIPDDVAVDLVTPYPAPDGSISRNLAFGRKTAADCARLSGDLLPYITTANTARDMDRIRAALGEPKLSYLGYSYGTYLGAVYTSLFPQRSDRILLDSAVDPKLVWYDMWRTMGVGMALRLPDFTEWAAARDATYHLGATQAAVTRTYYNLAARLDRTPVTLPDGFAFNGNVLREFTRSDLYGDILFPELAGGRQYLLNPSGPPPAAFDDTRQPTLPGVPSDNGTAALYSVVCDDAAWPRSVETFERNVAIGRRAFPAGAGMPDNAWPCAFWATRPVEPPVKVTDRGPRDVLILQNLRDPATPWVAGHGLRESLGQRPRSSAWTRAAMGCTCSPTPRARVISLPRS
jgi:pimeloyl-ACP methyl ester carboxylesterase